MENREFKGVWIPKEIWLNEDLNALEKIIYAEVDSFSSTEKGCIVSNEYLAEFCQCSASKVSKSIKKLIDLGLIEVVSFDGRHRKVRSRLVDYDRLHEEKQGRLVKNARQDSKKSYADCENMIAINIDNNIENNINDNNIYNHSKNDCILQSNNVTQVLPNCYADKDIDNKKSSTSKKPNLDNEVIITQNSNFENEFEELWKLYPKKQGKKQALKSYIKCRKRKTDQVTFDEVKQGIENYNSYIDKKKTEYQYILQGSTYFNQERWNDEYTKEQKELAFANPVFDDVDEEIDF